MRTSFIGLMLCLLVQHAVSAHAGLPQVSKHAAENFLGRRRLDSNYGGYYFTGENGEECHEEQKDSWDSNEREECFDEPYYMKCSTGYGKSGNDCVGCTGGFNRWSFIFMVRPRSIDRRTVLA